MATKRSIAQPSAAVQQPDGPHYNDALGEYEVWLAGQVIAYATHQGAAWHIYREALRTRREHVDRCPGDRSILWTVNAETRVLVMA